MVHFSSSLRKLFMVDVLTCNNLADGHMLGSADQLLGVLQPVKWYREIWRQTLPTSPNCSRDDHITDQELRQSPFEEENP